MLGEVWMVTSIALDAYTPALLRHAEDEGPASLRVQISVCEHEQTLVLLQLHVVFEIFKDLSCVELLHASVASDSRLHHALPLQLRKVLLDVIVFGLFRGAAVQIVVSSCALPFHSQH